MTLNDYMQSQYLDGGREWPRLDCYGLARLVRSDIYGLSLLPLLSGHGGRDKLKQTKDVMSNIHLLQKTDKATVGGLAFAFRRKLCEHIAVVVESNRVRRIMDINEQTGPRLLPLAAFEHMFNRVEYYD